MRKSLASKGLRARGAAGLSRWLSEAYFGQAMTIKKRMANGKPIAQNSSIMFFWLVSNWGSYSASSIKEEDESSKGNGENNANIEAPLDNENPCENLRDCKNCVNEYVWDNHFTAPVSLNQARRCQERNHSTQPHRAFDSLLNCLPTFPSLSPWKPHNKSCLWRNCKDLHLHQSTRLHSKFRNLSIRCMSYLS